jgi:hypothetical protein
VRSGGRGTHLRRAAALSRPTAQASPREAPAHALPRPPSTRLSTHGGTSRSRLTCTLSVYRQNVHESKKSNKIKYTTSYLARNPIKPITRMRIKSKQIRSKQIKANQIKCARATGTTAPTEIEPGPEVPVPALEALHIHGDRTHRLRSTHAHIRTHAWRKDPRRAHNSRPWCSYLLR